MKVLWHVKYLGKQFTSLQCKCTQINEFVLQIATCEEVVRRALPTMGHDMREAGNTCGATY